MVKHLGRDIGCVHRPTSHSPALPTRSFALHESAFCSKERVPVVFVFA